MQRSEVVVRLGALCEAAHHSDEYFAGDKWVFASENVARQVIGDLGRMAEVLRAHNEIVTYCRRGGVVLAHVEVVLTDSE